MSDLSLRWAHISEGTFSHAAAHIIEEDVLPPQKVSTPQKKKKKKKEKKKSRTLFLKGYIVCSKVNRKPQKFSPL